MGLSDHYLTLSGRGMTIAVLALAVLGSIWSSFILWIIRSIKRCCRLLDATLQPFVSGFVVSNVFGDLPCNHAIVLYDTNGRGLHYKRLGDLTCCCVVAVRLKINCEKNHFATEATSTSVRLLQIFIFGVVVI
jgi:hypothetical protein